MFNSVFAELNQEKKDFVFNEQEQVNSPFPYVLALDHPSDL